MGSLAASLYELYGYHEALSLDDDVLKIQRKAPCDQHPDTLNNMKHLAAILYKLGRNGEAPRLQRIGNVEARRL